MRHHNISFTCLTPIVLGLFLLGGCSEPSNDSNATAAPQAAAPVSPAATVEEYADVVATVEKEEITFSLLNTMLNSSAMVGLSIPALGTPERNQTIITLMDKAITANLLYLDALQKGVDQQPVYQQDISRFEEAILASLYREKILYGDIEVSEEEIQEYFKGSFEEGKELTDDDRFAIRASLRNAKLNTLKTRLRSRIREGVTVEIEPDVLNSDGDAARTDETVVARVDDTTITWGEVSELMLGADKRAGYAEFFLDSDTERQKRLDVYIDTRVMAIKGRAAGLETAPSYLERTREYRKTRLINLHRGQLLSDWSPSDEELKVFFEANKDRISVPEMRKVQMVVLKTQAEADDIKQRIDAGELTIFQAAMEYSIDPSAKQTLGDMGWVAHGSGFPELDELTFFLEPEVLGGPVESPAGWHLVKVLDVQDAQLINLGEPQTRRMTLRLYMGEKLDNYVIELRKNKFKVAVYEDELARQFKREAEFIAGLTEKAAKEGSVTSEREEDLKKWMQE
jgi:parvulin-like peptidyl-prolyl isomerase